MPVSFDPRNISANHPATQFLPPQAPEGPVFHQMVSQPEQKPVPTSKAMVPVIIERLHDSATFWDLYDALWTELDHVVTKRVTLLDSFTNGHLYIAKYDGNIDDASMEIRASQTRGRPGYLKAFVASDSGQSNSLATIFVTEKIQRRGIGRQMLQQASITRCLSCPNTTEHFLRAVGITPDQTYTIEEPQMICDLLRMAIAFNSDAVSRIEKRVNQPTPVEDLLAQAEEVRKKRRLTKRDPGATRTPSGKAGPAKKASTAEATSPQDLNQTDANAENGTAAADIGETSDCLMESVVEENNNREIVE